MRGSFSSAYLVIVHIQVVRCWEYCYKRWKTSCETLSIHSIPGRLYDDEDKWVEQQMRPTQHLELHEHEWWIANCYSARNHSTPGSCRSKSIRELCCVSRSRCFSHCRNLPTDRTTRGHTSDHMLAVLCTDQACGCRPNLESLVTVPRAHTRIAGSLMQLMANNRTHPCTHRKHVLNIWFYLKICRSNEWHWKEKKNKRRTFR